MTGRVAFGNKQGNPHIPMVLPLKRWWISTSAKSQGYPTHPNTMFGTWSTCHIPSNAYRVPIPSDPGIQVNKPGIFGRCSLGNQFLPPCSKNWPGDIRWPATQLRKALQKASCFINFIPFTPKRFPSWLFLPLLGFVCESSGQVI